MKMDNENGHSNKLTYQPTIQQTSDRPLANDWRGRIFNPGLFMGIVFFEDFIISLFFPSLFLSPPFHAELRRWIKGSFQTFTRTNIYDQEEEWILRKIEEDKKKKGKKKKVKKKSLETEF